VVLQAKKPWESWTWVSGDEVRMYDTDTDTLEIYEFKSGEDFKEVIDATVLVYGKPASYLKERYEIEYKKLKDSRIELLLTPEIETLKKRLESVRVVFDEKTCLLLAVCFLETSGDETELSLDNHKLNRGLKEGDFKIPTGNRTKVIRHKNEIDEVESDK